MIGDIHTLGPYYSHTLLNTVLAHSVRWGRSNPSIKVILDDLYQGGVTFGKHARAMVLEELSSGTATVSDTCSVPTVQALLLLSAQECSVGNTAQAWIYSGIAFRIIDHLGICVDGRRYPGSVQLSEDELWVPFGLLQTGDEQYPPSPAYTISCFTQMCKLSLTFNEILIHMYNPINPNSDAEMQECVAAQGPVLHEWWQQLPPSLKIDTANIPPRAPPSHIVTLK
jgi:hypothetical protein